MFSAMPFGFLFIFVFVFGSVLSLSSLHWIGIWVGLEVNLMGFIPILVYRGITQETESGMKYFIIQALGSGMVMLGSLSCFNVSFSWELMSLSSSLVGLVLLFFGLLLKLGSFPFHFWLPSVMAGISWVSCMILTTWQKVAPMFLLSSLLYDWAEKSAWVVSFLVLIAGFSSVVGGVGGLNQTQIRSLLAYSSIGHVGWMVFCGVCGENILKVYFLIYFVISICIFLVLWFSELSFFSQTGSLSSEGSKMNEVFLILMLLSLGGMPPFLGFVGKWLAIWLACNGCFPLCVVLLLVGSLVSLFYYLSLLFSMIFFSGCNVSSVGGYFLDFNVSDEGKSGLSEKLSGAVLYSDLGNFSGLMMINFIVVLNLMGGGFVYLSLLLSDFV
uniref:NADH-ubiquinone oxidoreductase chain 2 n=1 Tax=Lunella granulata TaxID=405982 RepID=A0A1I9SSS1_9VEST|nr:NADH dehydrogenase subunit 2 [Lunella granulata]AOZ71791.1 NADH dehydrogenase subunit 2 [Lunella granulata]